MIYVGDVGKVLELEFYDYEEVNGTMTAVGALNITQATEIKFFYMKPSGTVVTKTKTAAEVALSNGGADGKAKHVTESGFLDEAGDWEWQGWVQLQDGTEHYAEGVGFPVGTPLG